MKSLIGLTDVNGQPTSIFAIVKSGTEKLLEFSSPAAPRPNDAKLTSCYLLVAPDDVLNVTLTTDPGTVDKFDLYVDGILRASQPNPDPQKKSKVIFKKVCYKDGPNAAIRAYEMKVQPRTNQAAFFNDDSNSLPRIGSLVVKFWQKKAIPDQPESKDSGSGLSSVANAKSHTDWFNFSGNMILNCATPPSLHIGFTNGKAANKSKKTGKGLIDHLEDAISRSAGEYELFAEMTFLLRSSVELSTLGFHNVPSRLLGGSNTKKTKAEGNSEENNEATKDGATNNSSTKVPKSAKLKSETPDSSPALLTGPLPLITPKGDDRGDYPSLKIEEQKILVPDKMVTGENDESFEDEPSRMSHGTPERRHHDFDQEQIVSESHTEEIESPVQKPKVWNKLANSLLLKGYPNGPARKTSLNEQLATESQRRSLAPEPGLFRETYQNTVADLPPDLVNADLAKNLLNAELLNPPHSGQKLIHQNIFPSIEKEIQSTPNNEISGGIHPKVTSLTQATTVSASTGILDHDISNALDISNMPRELQSELAVEDSFDGLTEVADDEDILKSVESSRPTFSGASHSLNINAVNTSVGSESPTPGSQSFNLEDNFLQSQYDLIHRSVSSTLSSSRVDIPSLRPIVTEKSKIQANDNVDRQLFTTPDRINSKRPAAEPTKHRPEKHRRLDELARSQSSSLSRSLQQKPADEGSGDSIKTASLPDLRGADDLDLNKVQAEYDAQVELNNRLTERIEVYRKARRLHARTEDLRRKNKELEMEVKELAKL